jgi:hypothetical protein
MKKAILSFLCLFAITTFQVNAQNKEKAEGPMFKFIDGETHDFGVIKKGPPAGHTFEFTNVGTEPIIVMNVTPSCGCTNVDWSKNPVLPGQKGFIHLDLKTEEQNGIFHKEVYIQSNAKTPHGERRYTLYIKGDAKDNVTEEDLKKAQKGKAKKKTK